MGRFFVKVLVGSMVSILTVLSFIWIAGACSTGLYQPELPKEWNLD